jgi:hypothetical protein
MKVRKLLYLLNFAILIYLVGESFLQIDLAPTKNQHVTAYSQARVEHLQNIDSVKLEAKSWIEINRENFMIQSTRAKKRVSILLVLFIIQAILIIRYEKNKALQAH